MRLLRAGLLFLTIVFSAAAGDVPWDGEGMTAPENLPDPRWDNEDNWAGDTFPGTGDRALLLPPINTAFVHLVLQHTEVGSIDCRVPFKLDTKLILNGPSELTDALLPDGEGSIRSSSSVVLKGVNNARRVGFEGTGTFENRGTLLLEGDVASARLINNGPCFVLDYGTVRLNAFLNNNAFSITEGATVGSSSAVTNRGSFSMGAANGGTSFMMGSLFQESGIITVPADALASIVGGTQHYTGGGISVGAGAELLLSYSGGVVNGREFNGMPAITGTGNINQRASYTVKQNMTLSVDSPGRYSADDLDIAAGAVLTNSKQLELPGGANLSGAGLLYNTGTMLATNNPTLNVMIENAGTWNVGSFRVGTQIIANTGRINLKGNNLKIGRSGTNPGPLINDDGGTIRVDNGALTYTIEAPFEQLDEGLTEVVSGTLRFQGLDSIRLGGRFTADADGEYQLYSPLSQTGGGEILFDGDGTAIVGAVPWLSTLVINSGDSLRAKMGDFRQESANIIMRSGTRIRNERKYSWKGGKIYSTENANANRAFENVSKLVIEQGGTKQLGVKLRNIGDSANVEQYNTITLLDGGTTNGTGQIINGSQAHWRIRSIANIQGRMQTNPSPSEVSFLNEGRFFHEHPGASSIYVDFLNNDLVWVPQGVLHLHNVHNLKENGELSGGRWSMVEGASINFVQGNPVSLRDGAEWTGPIGAITNIGSSVKGEKPSKLQFFNNEVLTEPLTVSKTGTLGLIGTNTLTLADTLYVAGALIGQGRIKGAPITWSTGIDPSFLKPGSSPGTLTVEDDVTFGNTIYEWETAGTNLGESDQLVVTNATLDAVASLSGGIVPVLLDDYVPAPGAVFTILVANVVTGRFDYVSHAYLPPGMTFIPTYTSNAVTLTVGTTNYTDFSEWQGAQFSPSDLTNNIIAGLDADPDDDHLKNLAEYAHGLAPLVANDGVFSLSRSGAGTIDLHFPWLDGITDVIYEVHTSPDLSGTFTNTPFSLESASSDGVVSDVVLRLPISPESTNLFYKLKILPTP